MLGRNVSRHLPPLCGVLLLSAAAVIAEMEAAAGAAEAAAETAGAAAPPAFRSTTVLESCLFPSLGSIKVVFRSVVRWGKYCNSSTVVYGTLEPTNLRKSMAYR